MRGAAQVRVYLFGKLDEIGGDARLNLELVKKISLAEKNYFAAVSLAIYGDPSGNIEY